MTPVRLVTDISVAGDDALPTVAVCHVHEHVGNCYCV